MLRHIAIVTALVFSCAQADHEAGSSSQVLEMFPVSELDQVAEEPQPTLINGRVADPKDWPASMYSSQGNSRCTSTVVGPRTLMIAAHCVGNGARAQFKAAGVVYSSVCTHSPNYRGNSTADWALCLVEKEVPALPFESVNFDASLLKTGDELMLTGYGCVRPGGGGGNDGKYRIGEAYIQRLPRGTDNDIVTSRGAALCFGDSGGPAFKISGDKRVVVSVNSRGDIRATSYLSATHTEQAKTFFQAWATKNSQKICGLHEDAPGCRGGGITPPPPPPPPPASECEKTYKAVGVCLFGAKPSTLAAPDGCYKEVGKLFACLDRVAAKFFN